MHFFVFLLGLSATTIAAPLTGPDDPSTACTATADSSCTNPSTWRDANPCSGYNYAWDVTCWYHTIPSSFASDAIASACQQVSCSPGKNTPAASSPTFTGSGKGVSAKIRMGTWCGNGPNGWSYDTCVDIFTHKVNSLCGGDPNNSSSLFQLGYAKSECDQTVLNINYAG